MKTSYKKWIEILNSRLELFNQSIRVISFIKQELTLSNNTTLTGAEFTRFKKRVMNDKTDIWVNNMDNLLNGVVTEQQIKSKLSSIGGRAVQEKYGKSIALNLNTGIPWNKNMKGMYPYKFSPRTQDVKDKISKKNSGRNNGMFGVTMTDEAKEHRSGIMKQLILSGKFTPNSNNRNTHWDAMYGGKKYRSSWEALYQYINPAAEYETLRLEYILDTVTKIYIVDFIDTVNKQVIEVKPRELCNGDKFFAKLAALSNWADEHQYSVLIVDKEWLLNQNICIDYAEFDEMTADKIKALYEINTKN